MRLNRIDINPSLVIPEACRWGYMVQKALKSSKTYVNMQSIELKNSDKMGTNILQCFSMGYASAKFTIVQKKQLVLRAVEFQLITGQFHKMGFNEIIHRFILEHE